MHAISERWREIQPQFAVDAATLAAIWQTMTAKPMQGTIAIKTNLKNVLPEHDNNPFHGMLNVLVTPGESSDYLTATDGRVLAIVEADANDLEDRERLLPKSAAHEGDVVATSNGWQRTRKDAGATTWPDGNGKFPDTTVVLPAIDDKCIQLAIDAGYLKVLQEALNDADSHLIELIIRVDDNGYVTKPIAAVGNEGIGVVMPQQGIDPAEWREWREKYTRTVANYKAARARHKANGTAK